MIDNNYSVYHKDVLNEINGGICENMTYEEVTKKFPILYSNRKKDKFNFDKEVAPPVPPKKDEQNPLKREEDEAKKQDLKVNKF